MDTDLPAWAVSRDRGRFFASPIGPTRRTTSATGPGRRVARLRTVPLRQWTMPRKTVPVGVVLMVSVLLSGALAVRTPESKPPFKSR